MLAEFVLLLWMMRRSKLPFLGRSWLRAVSRRSAADLTRARIIEGFGIVV